MQKLNLMLIFWFIEYTQDDEPVTRPQELLDIESIFPLAYRVVGDPGSVDEVFIVQQIFTILASDLSEPHVWEPAASHWHPTPAGVIPHHDLCLDTHNKLVTASKERQHIQTVPTTTTTYWLATWCQMMEFPYLPTIPYCYQYLLNTT